ncbi:MAG TPA: GDSL-type esterase/lipase family protein [Burkholderiales bacterium]|nr:GDSL-type esterase/lipase family protein [Burkholderiales bacterium]
MKRSLVLIALAACAAVAAGAWLLAGSGEHRLADEIRAFEQQDRLQAPATGGVLFVGSSSIRLWPDLSAAFPGTAILQRGFGGAELADVLHFAPRIVLPYRPGTLVLYAGENEISAGIGADRILADLEKLVRLVHRELPGARIILLAVKPSPKRARFAPAIMAFNRALRSFAATDPRLAFVDIYTPMTNPDGSVRAELFAEDGLHMNAAGYEIWRKALAPVLRPAAGQSSASFIPSWLATKPRRS